MEGVIRESEKPSSFVPENSPSKAEWYWLDVPAMARTVGLPPDTPLMEASPLPLRHRALSTLTLQAGCGMLSQVTWSVNQAELPCMGRILNPVSDGVANA